ncbi:Lipopolysaccharide heptosyltransferase I [hydrothermal vent metagenome]|uniref:Lipopolysaccharide heptosyltransferase 1 n=1 Tax=hydrothermal vent metagenome TaxID=652676 RepID=A0A1W1EIA0_9ZZZZ
MKIVIIKLSAMGDIIHSMVALEFIKKKITENIKVDWIVEEGFKSILENNPNINNILSLNLKSIKKDKKNIFKEIKKVKEYSKNGYDIVIDAQGLIKSAITAKLISNKNSIIIGFSKNSIREKIASKFYDKHIHIDYSANTIDRNVKVICGALGIEVTSKEIIEKQQFLFFKKEFNQIDFDSKYNIFVIGSTWESRNYPKEKFVEIANRLKTATYISWGTQEEHTKALWMQQQSPYLQALPKVNLNELKEIIYHSNLLIGNDTGPTHMAWGLNTPSITIFGPTPINRIYITPINRAIKSKSKINHYKLDKNDYSIRDISVDEVIRNIKKI